MSSVTEIRISSGREVACSPVRKFSHEEYMRLHEQGYFQGERTELINGEIRAMQAQGPAHNFAVAELDSLLDHQLPRDRLGVFSQSTICLGTSSPEPDVFVTIGPRRNFMRRLATGESICLIIEVSDTTLAFDRGEKLSLYAEAGIGEYWIVNLPGRRIEVYTEPIAGDHQPARYQRQDVYGEKDRFERLVEGEKVVITTEELFVPAE